MKRYCHENNRGYSEDLFRRCLTQAEDKIKKKYSCKSIGEHEDEFNKASISFYFAKMGLWGFEGNKITADGSLKKSKDDTKLKSSQAIGFVADEQLQEWMEQWGEGFSPNEYRQLNKYYIELLGYYLVEDPVHRNLIKLAAMNSLLLEKALREGRTDESSKLQKSYSSILGDSKLKPSQENAADGTSLATVGQWVEKIELIDGKIPPYEIDEPDKIDKTIEYFLDKMKENLSAIGGI